MIILFLADKIFFAFTPFFFLFSYFFQFVGFIYLFGEVVAFPPEYHALFYCEDDKDRSRSAAYCHLFKMSTHL